jgi:beta-phosphoglucomutase-like phosphatase (HAD superfamily)
MPTLLILDCDGVLIDSEGVASQVTSRALAAKGWHLTPHECERRFIGTTFTDIARLAEPITGPLGQEWIAEVAAQLVETLQTEARCMPGAFEFVEKLVALGVNFRVASNSSHAEMRVKFARTGLDRLIPPDRIHSAADVMAFGGKPKPAPDLFLVAARAAAIDPAEAWVVEDSVAGVRAATVAGMLCYGFSLGAENPVLSALGAIPLRALGDLLPLLQPKFREAS